jgi:hypothetical protein
MKNTFFLLLFLLLASCASDTGLEMRPLEFSGEICDTCPVVRVSIPEAVNGHQLGRNVNTAIREEILELLDYDEERDAQDIPGAIAAFQQGFQQMQREFPEELTGWEASVKAFKSYEDSNVLSIQMDTYIFTGGAHGYPATTYLNFSKKTGEELDAEELFAEPGAFSEFAEAAFRKQYDIAPEAPINSTGFMFDENGFSLPQNIGLTTEGLILHYNPYEAASYADGALILRFPLSGVSSYMAWSD